MGTCCVDRKEIKQNSNVSEYAKKPKGKLINKKDLTHQELFIVDEIFKQRNTKMMKSIQAAYKTVSMNGPSKVEGERKRLELEKAEQQQKAADSYSPFLNQELFESSLELVQVQQIVRVREEELQKVIDSALQNKWLLPFIEVQHPALYINAFRHYKAVSLSMCQFFREQTGKIIEERALDIWIEISKHIKSQLRDIAEFVIEDSPDLVYNFDMMGEFYRLSEGEDAEIIGDINTFYHEMIKEIELERITIPIYDITQKYESAILDEYYRNLLIVAVGLEDKLAEVANRELSRLETPH